MNTWTFARVLGLVSTVGILSLPAHQANATPEGEAQLRYPTGIEVEGVQKTLNEALLKLAEQDADGFRRRIDYAIAQLKPKRPVVRMTAQPSELQCRYESGPLKGAFAHEACFLTSWETYAFQACYVGAAKTVAARIADREYHQGVIYLKNPKLVRVRSPLSTNAKREVVIDADLFDESNEAALSVRIPPC